MLAIEHKSEFVLKEEVPFLADRGVKIKKLKNLSKVTQLVTGNNGF